MSLSIEDRKKLKSVIGELTNSLLKIDAEREAMKEAISAAAEKFEIDKKQIRRIATTMYKRNYADVQAENEEFEILYETVIEGNEPSDNVTQLRATGVANLT
jgi:hypothetical protein